jgi:hypothetical protein
MDITKMMDQFNSVEEMKIFCSSQAKQIQKFALENKELKEKLAKAESGAKALVKAESKALTLPLDSSGVQDDAKIISQIQLSLLKEMSYDRELTSDEAKRVELYNRVLKEEAKDKKPQQADVEIVSASELLKLVENNG